MSAEASGEKTQKLAMWSTSNGKVGHVSSVSLAVRFSFRPPFAIDRIPDTPNKEALFW